MPLTNEHINYIIKDIHYRGIVFEELGEELVDHICTLVEDRMENGQRFIEAYDEVLLLFGKEKEIQDLQSQTIQLRNNNTKIMLRNYVKMAVRNLMNHKFYSIINISGLAISVACCLVISLFVLDELSYDRFFKDSQSIYRTNSHGKFGENEYHFATAPAPLGKALIAEIPEIEQAVRFRSSGSFLVRTESMAESFKENRLVFTDPTFFNLFSIATLAGNPEEALKNPNTIAISQSMAAKYFKGVDAIGQQMILDGDEEYQVTAIFEDIPSNSHLNFDFLLSMETLESSRSQIWASNNFYTYFKIRDGADPLVVKNKINEMADIHFEPQLKALTGNTMEEFKAAGNYVTYDIQPLSDVYLKSSFSFDIGKTGDITYVYLFTLIALFILVIACINFMNLSTARSANRAKEVGVRKVLGSYKSHLVRQFLTESILLSIISFILSIGLIKVCLPFFNSISNKSLTIPFDQPLFYLIILGGALFTGVLAGIYPAFFLSSFRPVNVLKGQLALGSKSGLIRSGLVVFQFLISIILLIGTVTVYKQLNFIQNKKLGFNKEQVLIINDTYVLGDKEPLFQEKVLALSSVTSASSTGFVPVGGYNRSDQTYWEQGKEPNQDNLVNMQGWYVDEYYLETMGIELLDGRNFDRTIASDSNAVILNETAFKAYGFKRDKENTILAFGFDDSATTITQDEYIAYKVIGIIKDFHFETMKQPINKLGLFLKKGNGGTLSIRLRTDDFASSIEQVDDIWKSFSPGLPLTYSFLDSAFNKMYSVERRLAEVFTIFAGLAMLIGCLGLFALASFMAEQRTKEIGIRKVMGASVKSIVFMLSKEFSKLIIIAFALAVPLAWWGISQWLGQYSYKIVIGMEVYIFAGLIAFIIAWLTVGYQSIKAAINNPANSLRNE